MTFLPVVARELRVAARRRHVYWTRFFTALATLALCTWVWMVEDPLQPAHQRGQVLFRFIAGLAFILGLVAGIGITSDSLSEEKREGTLGLLFLTDLKGYDVVLGKLAATSLNALYRLFAVFPILAIPLLLGALTLGEFWRMTLVLTNTLFFSLSVGMLVSAVSLRERHAMAGTALLILLITAGPPLVGLIWAIRHKVTVYPSLCLMSSAVYPAYLALDAAFKVHSKEFWTALATTHGLGWTFLAAASVLVRNTWQDRPAGGTSARWRDRWRDWQFGHGSLRAEFRRRLLDVNPIYWLSGRDRLKPVFVWGVLAGIGLLWLWLYWKYSHALLDSAFCVLTPYALHTVVKLWLATEACRPLGEDRRSGTLELVLSTPLTVDEILSGEILALKRQFAWPVGAILCADMAMFMAGLRDMTFESSNDWLFLCLALMITFVADLYTLAWVGLWLGLSSRKSNRAASGAIGRVLVLPWAIFVLGIGLFLILQPANFEPSGFGLLGVGFGLSMLNDAIFFGWASTNLRSRFRLAATQRFQTAPADQIIPSATQAPQVTIPSVLAQ